jgi:tetratricopeptide (TPR) repeat protein
VAHLPTDDDQGPPTTSGAIAVVNLHAQIDSLTAAAARSTSGWSAPQGMAEELLVLIDLLTLRGHFLGRIADYEQAQDLAEWLVRNAPNDPIALPARARTRATFHRFDEATADLDCAEACGLDRPTLQTERAVIRQALGDHAQAQALYDSAAQRPPGFAALAALAVLHAESGNLAEAEPLFTEARRQYRGASPFPIASLDFRRGLMWIRVGDVSTAYAWLDASRRRVPGYAPVLARLADIDMTQGAHETAVDRLSPLASSSDDPAYAAALARALTSTGRLHEAGRQRAIAAARYEQLALRHPAAYAGHAADFRRDTMYAGFAARAGRS